MNTTATTSDSSVSFEETGTRPDDMNVPSDSRSTTSSPASTTYRPARNSKGGSMSRVGSTTTPTGTRSSSNNSAPRRLAWRATERGRRSSTGTFRRASRRSGSGRRSSRGSARSAKTRRTLHRTRSMIVSRPLRQSPARVAFNDHVIHSYWSFYMEYSVRHQSLLTFVLPANATGSRAFWYKTTS